MASSDIIDSLFPPVDRINDRVSSLSRPPRAPSVAPSLTYSDESEDQEEDVPNPAEQPRRRRASTRLIASSAADVQRITGETTAQIITRCCGGGCCLNLSPKKKGVEYESVPLPDNDAFRSLNLRLDGVIPTSLSHVHEMPEQTTFLEPIRSSPSRKDPPSPTDSAISIDKSILATSSEAADNHTNANTAVEDSAPAKDAVPEHVDTTIQPPRFVQPHPPYNVFPARIHNARELTGAGAEKRTYHFDLDVTNYPEESGIDFRVGGAIGIMAPNDTAIVDEVLDCLLIPRFQRDKTVLLRTTTGRWPTVWGDDQARELITTRRDLLTWCSDLQSYPANKPLLRVLAEYADNEDERKTLLYLCSAEGQGIFCDFRTGPHISIPQLLRAFPSSHPPLDVLLSVLQQLMPRFYSLSNDPHEEPSLQSGHHQERRRIVEIAVTVHEAHDWRTGVRTGIGSGFFERQAKRFLAATAAGEKAPEIYVPMFKGLMANPLATEFIADGPMLLIGAGVGIAPFRGFVQRRLKTANCANKVWVIQGIRDSLVDEIYSGEWGVHEEELKKIVESRRGEGRYVQEEVRHQSDLVWKVINSVDGRIFVCGSSRGMGEGVEEALVDVAMEKGNLGREEAKKYWKLKKEAGQYIAETW
ncbi:related to methionine synthase reductase [Cephalotrichum gorgonifer]|uniref:Related to methionine synthase reductase n=1 Tax=Cephalotrichum gorgonifer TaxID=2041049 RepID=A0AAE8SSQ7_9PEZI|nr:related to methionine synthase reductase [Cephalotrichum gorgonifer]